MAKYIPNNSTISPVVNADTVTTNANLTGHVTSVGNAAVLGSFTVAQLSTAISNATLSGNNTGDQTNVSGTAATVTGAAQTNITSVGTLTAVTVSGNINANGNIVGDDGTNITNIASVSCDNIYFDGDGATGIEMGANDVSIVDSDGNKNTTFTNDTLEVGVDSTIKIIFNNLPTSNPGVTGQLWNNSGVLNISG
tara:strand:- start:40 stop:624 length:585 start_codon:yes stop_codon:yes gene_type:complete